MQPSYASILLVLTLVSASPTALPASERRGNPVQGRTSGWQIRLTSHEMLVAKPGKTTDYVYSIKNTRTGQERPSAELNQWFVWWNHHHIAFSPDGRWAVWRDADTGLIASSLHGEMKRIVWKDQGDEHDPLVWLPGSKRFVEVEDFKKEKHGKWRRHSEEVFDVASPKRRTRRVLTAQEAIRLDK